MTDLLLPAAALGPGAAAVVWVALAAWRWPRRAAGALVALAAHAGAWAVFWLAYRGEPPTWRSLEATLLGASVLVATELALLLVGLRAEGLRRRAALGSVAALGVSATAVAFASFSTSLVVQALFLPAVTLAAALAGLSGTGRRDLAGVLGLAAADVACLAGLAIWASRLGSVVVAPVDFVDLAPLDRLLVRLGISLVLAGAAVKAGAVPGLGTWRLAATTGPGAPVAVALRGQGIAMAVLAGVVVAGSEGSVVLAGLAAAAALAGGVAAAVSAHRGSVLGGIAGAAACVPFVALGLGGAVGARAFLLSFPPLLLASGVAFAVGWPGHAETTNPPPREKGGEGTGRLRRWIGVPAALGAVVSLAALPGGGGHPGVALALDLAGVRAQTDILYLGVAAALMLGLGMAAVAAAPVVAAARPPILAGLASLVAGAALVYMGSQPVRLGIGWWLRIEQALQVPGLLPSAGAPSFPAARGLDLALALAPAAGAVTLIAILGRGVRPGPAEVGPIRPPRARVPVPAAASGVETPGRLERGPEKAASATERPKVGMAKPTRWKRAAGEIARRAGLATGAVGRPTGVIARAVTGRAAQLRARAHRMALGLAVAALLEAGAVALSVFLVMEGVRLGFL